jgi:hypothetical protein
LSLAIGFVLALSVAVKDLANGRELARSAKARFEGA